MEKHTNGDPVITDRDSYEDALAEELVQWRGRFEALTAQAGQRLNSKGRGGKAFRALAGKHAQLIRCLRHVRDATDTSWLEWRERTDQAWLALQGATDDAAASLTRGSGSEDEELDLAPALNPNHV